MATDTNLNQLVINKLSKAQYQEAKETNSIVETELYFVTDSGDINADTLGGVPAEDYATKDDLNAIDFPVDSVNGKTGAVTLSASDVGAAPVDIYERLNRKTKIPSDADLNTYTTAGSYAIVMAAEGATIANVPYASACGTLIVTSMRSTDEDGYRAGVWQKFYGYDGNTYERCTKDGSSWDAWKKYADSSHTHSYLPLSGGTITGSLTATGGLTANSTNARKATLNASDIQAYLCSRQTDGTVMNAMYLKDDSTTLMKPLAIGSGGTGATDRLGAAKNLTNEAVSSPNYVVGFTNSWGKFGYTSLAQLKTSLGMKVLWKNASPGSAFAAQTITVSGLSSCSCIAIIFRQAGKQHMVCIQHRDVSDSLGTIANGTRWESGAMYVVEREVTTNFSNQTINFKTHAQNGGAGTDRAVPLAVIGLW